MPLLLTGTWEHALLAATARAVAGHSDKGHLGLGALQKVVYFLFLSGVPMRYRFDFYHASPFCARIAWDIDLLLADGVLQDISANPEKYSDYRPANEADELLQAHAEALGAHQKTIDTVVRTLLPLEPEHLEMLATLDYLYRNKKAGGGPGPWKERVINFFMEVKKDKFPREAVSAAYDSMVRANLLEA
jgi:uncharacterized protein YwgA